MIIFLLYIIFLYIDMCEMQKISIGVIGYSNNYDKFIKNIKNSISNYNLKFILKKTELKKPNFQNKIINLIKNNKIKFLIVCDKSVNKKYLSNIEFLIEKKNSYSSSIYEF